MGPKCCLSYSGRWNLQLEQRTQSVGQRCSVSSWCPSDEAVIFWFGFCLFDFVVVLVTVLCFSFSLLLSFALFLIAF